MQNAEWLEMRNPGGGVGGAIVEVDFFDEAEGELVVLEEDLVAGVVPGGNLVPSRHADYQAHGEIAASPCLNGLPEQIEFPSVEPHSRAGSATVHNDVLNNFLLHLGPINGAPTLGLSRRSDVQLAIAARRQAFKLRLSSLPVAPDTSIAN
jgi:hypothetical protein